MYKEFLKNLVKYECISKARRNILSEKGSRLITSRLEDFGYIKIDCNLIDTHNNRIILTEKGQQLLSNLNDFNFKFHDKEIFGGLE
jgi:hypothetical protein